MSGIVPGQWAAPIWFREWQCRVPTPVKNQGLHLRGLFLVPRMAVVRSYPRKKHRESRLFVFDLVLRMTATLSYIQENIKHSVCVFFSPPQAIFWGVWVHRNIKNMSFGPPQAIFLGFEGTKTLKLNVFGPPQAIFFQNNIFLHCSETFKNEVFSPPQAEIFWTSDRFNKKAPPPCLSRIWNKGGFLNNNITGRWRI